MVPYVIRRGDTLQSLAHAMRFDADAVWNDPKNADLRKARPNPNLLCATDVLFVPDDADRAKAWLPVQVGQSNSFVATIPKVTVSVTLSHDGKPIANEACVVHELPAVTGLTTDGSGTLRVDAPVTMQQITVEVSSSGARYRLRVGHLDPVTTDSGAYQRLVNLGYIGKTHPRTGGCSPDAVREGATAFQRDKGLPVTGVMDDATQSALESAHGC